MRVHTKDGKCYDICPLNVGQFGTVMMLWKQGVLMGGFTYMNRTIFYSEVDVIKTMKRAPKDIEDVPLKEGK